MTTPLLTKNNKVKIAWADGETRTGVVGTKSIGKGKMTFVTVNYDDGSKGRFCLETMRLDTIVTKVG